MALSKGIADFVREMKKENFNLKKLNAGIDTLVASILTQTDANQRIYDLFSLSDSLAKAYSVNKATNSAEALLKLNFQLMEHIKEIDNFRPSKDQISKAAMYESIISNHHNLVHDIKKFKPDAAQAKVFTDFIDALGKRCVNAIVKKTDFTLNKKTTDDLVELMQVFLKFYTSKLKLKPDEKELADVLRFHLEQTFSQLHMRGAEKIKIFESLQSELLKSQNPQAASTAPAPAPATTTDTASAADQPAGLSVEEYVDLLVTYSGAQKLGDLEDFGITGEEGPASDAEGDNNYLPEFSHNADNADQAETELTDPMPVDQPEITQLEGTTLRSAPIRFFNVSPTPPMPPMSPISARSKRSSSEIITVEEAELSPEQKILRLEEIIEAQKMAIQNQGRVINRQASMLAELQETLNQYQGRPFKR